MLMYALWKCFLPGEMLSLVFSVWHGRVSPLLGFGLRAVAPAPETLEIQPLSPEL